MSVTVEPNLSYSYSLHNNGIIDRTLTLSIRDDIDHFFFRFFDDHGKLLCFGWRSLTNNPDILPALRENRIPDLFRRVVLIMDDENTIREILAQPEPS